MFWLKVGTQENARKGIKLIFGIVLNARCFDMLGSERYLENHYVPTLGIMTSQDKQRMIMSYAA